MKTQEASPDNVIFNLNAFLFKTEISFQIQTQKRNKKQHPIQEKHKPKLAASYNNGIFENQCLVGISAFQIHLCFLWYICNLKLFLNCTKLLEISLYFF